MIFLLFSNVFVRTIFAKYYSLFTLIKMTLGHLKRIQQNITLIRTLNDLLNALIQMLLILTKRNNSILNTAIIIFTPDSDFIPHTQNYLHKLLWFFISAITNRTIVFVLVLILPCLETIKACDCSFTLLTHNWIISKICANTTYKLLRYC